MMGSTGDDTGHSHGHSYAASPAAAAELDRHSHHAAAEDVCLGADQRDRRHDHDETMNTILSEAQANQRKLKRATAFVLVFFAVEVIGGVWSGSLAIISDAAHLLADVSGFILAMVANEIASQPASATLTYGPVRAEVLSALFSTVTILVLSMLLVYSAIVRLIAFSRGEGEDIDGRMMSFIALLGLLVNIALLGIFGHEHGGHDHSHGHAHTHDETNKDAPYHHHHHGGDAEEGLAYAGNRVGGGAERAPLVHGINTSSSASLDISGSSRSSGAISLEAGGGGGVDKYGSLVAADGGGGRASEGAEGFGELGEKAVVGGGEMVTLKKTTKNINMEAAVLHAVTDLIQSAGVLLAGLLIWYDARWKWADPVATLFFVGLVVHSTRRLLNRAFNVLLEGVPDSIDYEQLRKRLSDIEGVTDLHCLHVWSLTLGRTVVSAHIKATDPEEALASAHEICEAMGVAHSTIQVQRDHCLPESCKHPCVSAVGRCCGTEGNAGSPRSPRRAPSLPP
ncbi:unnamed protein product [Pylaiella littoralis]